MKILKNNKFLNYISIALFIAIVIVIIIGVSNMHAKKNTEFSDNIEQIDLNTIYFNDSGVEVQFSDVLLSNQKENRKLIVSEQEAKVSTKLTDRLIKKLDFDFLKKTQEVSYTGKGCFVVDLDNLTNKNIIQDDKNKILTIKIDHAYLQAIEIDPDKIIIDEVKEGLLARGDIELTVADYKEIEKELRTRMEKEFNTVKNANEADDIALKMVKDIYTPIVKAIDKKYDVVVEFK